jgi:hypothetical protein
MLGTELTSPELQYGAFALCVVILGLCALMYRSNQQERKDFQQERKLLGQKIDAKEQLYVDRVQMSDRLMADHTEAMNRLSEALEVRPCLVGDRVFRKSKDQS